MKCLPQAATNKTKHLPTTNRNPKRPVSRVTGELQKTRKDGECNRKEIEESTFGIPVYSGLSDIGTVHDRTGSVSSMSWGVFLCPRDFSCCSQIA
jgi:hypothetical protein